MKKFAVFFGLAVFAGLIIFFSVKEGRVLDGESSKTFDLRKSGENLSAESETGALSQEALTDRSEGQKRPLFELSLKKILEANGPGEIRWHNLRGLYLTSDTPISEMLESLAILEDSDDLAIALDVIGGKIGSYGEISELLKYDSQIRSLPESLRVRLLSSALHMLSGAAIEEMEDSERSRRISEAVHYVKMNFGIEGQLTNQTFVTLLRQVGEFSPRFFWDCISDHFPQYASNPEVQSRLISYLVSQDPEEALKIIDTDDKFSLESGLSIVEALWKRDKRKAKEIFDQLPKDSLSREPFLLFLAEQMVKVGDLDDAKNYLELSQDEKVQKKIGYAIWKHEVSSVRKEMRNDQEATIEKIVSDDGKYDVRYLENAVSEWIEIDSEAAADWLDENMSKLPPHTLQFAAASYSKEALSQGNVVLARQWANLIEDEKTLTRINGIIEKAEQAASN